METFTAPRRFVKNPRYTKDREDTLAAMDIHLIDGPIADIIAGFNTVSHCFTMQSCYGHFVCTPAQDPRSIDPVPGACAAPVRYRIAYIGFCLENNQRGWTLQESLARVPVIDPDYVQFGSADWFWERWKNSYALQVEPVAYQLKDEVILEPAEAHHVQWVRGRFFTELRALLTAELRAAG